MTDSASPTHEPLESGKPMPMITDRDIVFTCSVCGGELVVDRDGAGMVVPCPHCSQSLTIPELQSPSSNLPAPAPASAEISTPTVPRQFDFSGQTPEQLERRESELRHQLKENRSQDTEMRGHVNRATMELHRYQLKLKKLQERQSDIEAELTAVQTFASEKDR